MNQIAFYNIEKEIEGRAYRLSMQIGSPWEEAIAISQAFADKVKEIAALAEAQRKASEEIKPELTE
jgi:hypothetical protein